MLAQITAPHFCAGIVLRDDAVTEAAPILRYMVGWSRNRVRSYCKRRDWKIVIVSRRKTPDTQA